MPRAPVPASPFLFLSALVASVASTSCIEKATIDVVRPSLSTSTIGGPQPYGPTLLVSARACAKGDQVCGQLAWNRLCYEDKKRETIHEDQVIAAPSRSAGIAWTVGGVVATALSAALASFGGYSASRDKAWGTGLAIGSGISGAAGIGAAITGLVTLTTKPRIVQRDVVTRNEDIPEREPNRACGQSFGMVAIVVRKASGLEPVEVAEDGSFVIERMKVPDAVHAVKLVLRPHTTFIELDVQRGEAEPQ
jgi:hypothetical protein